jgi:hypothetical protein
LINRRIIRKSLRYLRFQQDNIALFTKTFFVLSSGSALHVSEVVLGTDLVVLLAFSSLHKIYVRAVLPAGR